MGLYRHPPKKAERSAFERNPGEKQVLLLLFLSVVPEKCHILFFSQRGGSASLSVVTPLRGSTRMP